MAVRVLWTGLALDDLRALGAHVARDDPKAARKLARAIRRRVASLADHPRTGRVVPELPDDEYREVVVPPCRVVYTCTETAIIIRRVWHGRRDMSKGW